MKIISHIKINIWHNDILRSKKDGCGVRIPAGDVSFDFAQTLLENNDSNSSLCLSSATLSSLAFVVNLSRERNS